MPKCLKLCVVFVSCFTLSFVVGSLIFIPYDSSAESVNVDVNLTIEPAITLAVSPQPTILLDITPTPLGHEVIRQITATVSTNNSTGYILTMSTISDATALAHTNTVNTMPSTTSLAAATLPVNTWGYNKGVGATTFLAIPPLSTPDTIATATAPVNNDTTIVTVGAKADVNILPGVYSNTLIFTAVMNYVPGTPIVTGILPAAAEAGDTVTITGVDFFAGGASGAVSSVTIGGTACVSFNVTSDTSLTCVLPALAVGDFPIVVVTSLGTSNNDVTVAIIEQLIPPPGSIPDNIGPLNQAILDVYPTTGWEGDVVTITGNAIFTDVVSVTIGGTACTQYNVISTSVILCKLPAQTNGSTNNIVVMNGATNVTNAATFRHMRVTYFDPSSPTVTIGGITYTYYPNGFTRANCLSLTPSNSASSNIPASLVYVRDTRNNQVYKVKRMIDQKCWMIDNLKYINTTLANSDGSFGTIFRNGSGVNNPPVATSNFNTVDGTNTQSATNSNKAFYNNAMRNTDCYGVNASFMATNTLTYCSYLYNWYAATGGTGTFNVSAGGTNVTGSICLVNFELPSSLSGTGGRKTTGTSPNVADFTTLNASMAAGSLTTGAISPGSSFAGNWMPSGPWSGVLGTSFVTSTPPSGQFWSSTVLSTTIAYSLRLLDSPAVYPDAQNQKYVGLAVRCILAP